MNPAYALGHEDLERLLLRWQSKGHQTVGPHVRSAVIVLDHLMGLADLPGGRQDRQQAGGTCFCTPMRSGPRVQTGFDIVLTEFPDQHRPRLLAEAGSVRGDRLLRRLRLKQAACEDRPWAELLCRQAARGMGRRMAQDQVKALLGDHFTHSRWEIVETKCLACGNGTLVCPTCFCHAITDYPSLDGRQAERRRFWDSCFRRDFAYIHGGSLRVDVFYQVPNKADLKSLVDEIRRARDAAYETVHWTAAFDFPDFERGSEQVALRDTVQ